MTGASKTILSFTGGSIVFTVTGGSSTTSNVLNVRSGSTITLTVNYEITTASTGSLNTTSVYPGNSITLTIKPSDSSFTHTVQWYRDANHTSTVNVAAGVTSSSYTIPAGWPVGSASVTLSTYSGGAIVGSNTYSFTIATNPSTIVPTAGTLNVSISQSPYIPSAWGVYVKGYSRAYLSLTGSSAGSGASYKSIAFSCGSQTQNTASTTTFTTSVLLETGTITCTAKVTNSSDNSASAASKTITVYDYSSPSFVSVTAFRCTQDGTPSDSGRYFGVTASVSIASVNGLNRLAALQAQYAPSGSTAWTGTANIQNGQLAIIGGNATGSGSYQIRVIAVDSVQNLQGTNSNVTVAALTSEHVIFCRDGGLNVSFGMEGTRQNAVEINPNWHIYHGDEMLDGVTSIARGGTGGSTAQQGMSNIMLNIADVNLDDWNDRMLFLDVTSNLARRISLSTLNSFFGFVNSILSVGRGGTGATNAADARTNLGITPSNIGAAAASHNHDAGNITSGTLAAARIPFKIARGSITINGSSSVNVSYASTGFTGVPHVVATYSTTDGNWSGDNGAIKIHSKTASGFSIVVGGTSSDRLVDWIAIGT